MRREDVCDVGAVLFRELQQGGGVISGVDKQCLIARNEQVAVVVHGGYGDAVQNERHTDRVLLFEYKTTDEGCTQWLIG